MNEAWTFSWQDYAESQGIFYIYMFFIYGLFTYLIYQIYYNYMAMEGQSIQVHSKVGKSGSTPLGFKKRIDR